VTSLDKHVTVAMDAAAGMAMTAAAARTAKTAVSAGMAMIAATTVATTARETTVGPAGRGTARTRRGDHFTAKSF